MKILTSFVVLVLFLAAAILTATTSSVNASIGFANCTKNFIGNFLPAQPWNSTQICRDGAIAISYSGWIRDPNWSQYYITPEDVAKNIAGRLSFYADPDLKALGVPQASNDAEVFGDEWNRGHLAPSRIMSYSEDTKKACYSMANIAPQYYKSNQGEWQYLETDVFNWIGGNTALYIVTGVAYIDPDHPTFGPEKLIAIPDFYWKAICDPVSGQSAAFYAYNKAATAVVVSAADKHNHAKFAAAAAKGVKVLNMTSGNGQIPRLANGMENFLTVRELEDKIYKHGAIFPADKCRTDRVDESYWGWSTESYGMFNLKKMIETQPEDADRILKEMYEQHRRQFQEKKMKKQ